MRKSVDVSDKENDMLKAIGEDLGIKHHAAIFRYLLREYYRNHLEGA